MTVTTIAARARRALIAATVASALVVPAGCSSGAGGDKTTGPTTGPVPTTGMYTLRTIDNSKLPGEIYHGPYFDDAAKRFYNQMIVSVKDGFLSLNAGNRWILTFDATVTQDGKVGTGTYYDEGRYEIRDSEIQLISNSAGVAPVIGTLSRNGLTFDADFMKRERLQSFGFTRDP